MNKDKIYEEVVKDYCKHFGIDVTTYGDGGDRFLVVLHDDGELFFHADSWASAYEGVSEEVIENFSDGSLALRSYQIIGLGLVDLLEDLKREDAFDLNKKEEAFK